MGGLEALEEGEGEGFEDKLEVEKELEDDEIKDVQEEGVGVDRREGGEVRNDNRVVSLPIRGG